jgi:hypothetical protein
MAVHFKATVYQRGHGARIDIPRSATAAFGDTGYVPVRGTMNGAGFRGTLMPAGGGRHILNINSEMRRRAAVDVGEAVMFTLDRGEATRVPPMSRELAAALERDPHAKATWQAFTPAKRKRALFRLERLERLDRLSGGDATRREVERLVGALHTGGA